MRRGEKWSGVGMRGRSSEELLNLWRRVVHELQRGHGRGCVGQARVQKEPRMSARAQGALGLWTDARGKAGHYDIPINASPSRVVRFQSEGAMEYNKVPNSVHEKGLSPGERKNGVSEEWSK